MGVSALSVSLIHGFLKKWPEAQITLLVSGQCEDSYLFSKDDYKVEIPILNNRLSPREPLEKNLFWMLFLAFLQRIIPITSVKKRIIRSNPFLKALCRADFVGDIFSGDSFSDIYGLKTFLRLCLSRVVALFLGKELVMLPQTYGPYKSPVAKLMAKYIVKRSKLMFARDLEGADCIRKLMGDAAGKKRVRLCPDVAFELESRLPDSPNIQPRLKKKASGLLVGINVNGLLYNYPESDGGNFDLRIDYRQLVHEVVDRFLRETKAHILLVPHTFADPGSIECDPDACAKVQHAFGNCYPGRVHLVAQEYNQHEIKGIIGMCSFFVGSRMHACIAAISQGIPAVGVAYSKKFKGVFDTVGIGEMVLDARQLDQETIVGNVMEHFRNNVDARRKLKGTIATASNHLSETYDFIASMS